MINQMLIPLIASTAAILPQCQPPAPPERPAQVIWVGQIYPMTFNAESGDTVNIIMNDDSDEMAELIWCNDSGGTLERNPYTEVLTCLDIDF